jgi:hypothetical protein
MDIIGPYVKKLQMALDKAYPAGLWVFDKGVDRYAAYAGSYEQVVDTVFLLNGDKFDAKQVKTRITAYQFEMHGQIEFMDAKAVFERNFTLHLAGDILEIKGNLWEVCWIHEFVVHLQSLDGYKQMEMDKKTSYTLIYSKYFHFDIRDRLQRLLS